MPGFSGATGVSKKYVDDKIAQSTALVKQTINYGNTMQLNSDIMSCTLVSLTFLRYGYYDTIVVPMDAIKAGSTTQGAFIKYNAADIKVVISITGLITLTGTGAEQLSLIATGIK